MFKVSPYILCEETLNVTCHPALLRIGYSVHRETSGTG